MEPVKILDTDDIQGIMDEIMLYSSRNDCNYEDIEYHIFKDGSTKVLQNTTSQYAESCTTCLHKNSESEEKQCKFCLRNCSTNNDDRYERA
jgi:hypothetical protein